MSLTSQNDIETALKSILTEENNKFNIGNITNTINSLRFSSVTRHFDLFMKVLSKIRTDANIANTIIHPRFIRAKAVSDFRLALILSSDKAINDSWMCYYLIKSFILKDYCHIKTKMFIPIIRKIMSNQMAFIHVLIEILKSNKNCHTNSFVYCFLNLRLEVFEYLDTGSRNLLFNTFEEYIRDRIWNPKLLISRFGSYILKAANFIKRFRDVLVISEYIKRYVDNYEILLIEYDNKEVNKLVKENLKTTNEIINFVKGIKNQHVQLNIIKTLFKNVTRYLFSNFIVGNYDYDVSKQFANILVEMLSLIKPDIEFKHIALSYLRIAKIINNNKPTTALYTIFLKTKEPKIFKESHNTDNVLKLIEAIQKTNGTSSHQAISEYLHILPADLYILNSYLSIYASQSHSQTYNPECLEQKLKSFINDYIIYIDKNTIFEIQNLISFLQIFTLLRNGNISESHKKTILDHFLIENIDIIFQSQQELLSLYLLFLTNKHQLLVLEEMVSRPLSIIIPRNLLRNRISSQVDLDIQTNMSDKMLNMTLTKRNNQYDNQNFIIELLSIENIHKELINQYTIILSKNQPCVLSLPIETLTSSIEIAIYMQLPESKALIKRLFKSI